jgi:hypothetical protein
MRYKSKSLIAALAAMATICAANLNFITPAHAEDTMSDATESTWGVISTNDGFDKTLTIYKDGDNYGLDDYGDQITYTAEIQCSKKKLTFMVYSDPIGIYPSTTFSSIDGYALAKIDSGKIVKYAYIALKDSSGIFFNSPKTVTAAVLKGKNKFSFKIPSSIQNATVANFSIGDLASYVTKFKSLGCALK